jgi:membrane-associated progesterone receptor component
MLSELHETLTSNLWAFGAVVLVFVLWLRHITLSRTTIVEEPPKAIFIPRPFTKDELEKYDGVQNPLIFVCVKGIVYNVAREWYGPQSAYNAFAGREASRHLGKTVVGREESNCDWTTLSPQHLQTLNEWEERFSMKYVKVGWFVPDEDYFAKAKGFDP